MEPIEKLLTVADGAADPATLRWFRDCLAAYLCSDENRLSLEKAFSLSSSGQGKPSARTQYMKSLRDSYLQTAFTLIDPDKKTMQRCDQLAREITRFETVLWPRWRNLAEPPVDGSELRKLLYQAKRTREPLPTSRQAVYQTVFQSRKIINNHRFLF